MSYGQCIECGNELHAHHGVDGLSIRCGHGERIAVLERSLAALRALVEKKDKALRGCVGRLARLCHSARVLGKV